MGCLFSVPRPMCSPPQCSPLSLGDLSEMAQPSSVCGVLLLICVASSPWTCFLVAPQMQPAWNVISCVWQWHTPPLPEGRGGGASLRSPTGTSTWWFHFLGCLEFLLSPPCHQSHCLGLVPSNQLSWLLSFQPDLRAAVCSLPKALIDLGRCPAAAGAATSLQN